MKEIIVAGVDEAGRGAVIGPLVVAGVSILEKDLPRLKKLGVRDSKLLSPRRREHMADRIEKIARDVLILSVGPCKIDNMRNRGINLNRIETIKFAEVLSFLKAKKAYVDSPDVKPERLKDQLKEMVGKDMEIVAEHKADYTYPVVSAASIMAKVTRDEEVAKISKKYGDVGPGYSSNSVTMEWMRNWIRDHKGYPDGVVRMTWETTRTVMGNRKQKGLGNFFKKLKGN